MPSLKHLPAENDDCISEQLSRLDVEDEELSALSAPTRAELDACTFSSWYPTFKGDSPRAKIIKPLPETFIQYLLEDGINLPLEHGNEGVPESQFESDSEDEDEAVEDDEDDVTAPVFPELQKEISSIIEEFGAVFPKLNWSSPRDASWMALGGSLQCRTLSDVFLLLKSSDCVVHDLCHAYEECVRDEIKAEKDEKAGSKTFELILKKWYDVAPSMEFRCFVKEGNVVAITQRDLNYYEFLREMKDDIKTKIVEFFDEKIDQRFPNRNYVFDVYITRDMRRVWLMDFNIFYHTTDALLFTWNDIINASEGEIEFRIITSQGEANRCAGNVAYAMNRYPKEMFTLSNGVSLAEFAANVSREFRKQAEEAEDD